MKLLKLLNENISILEAVELIKSNEEQGYIFIPVKNEHDCLFELGGRNYEGNIEFKVCIPKYNNCLPYQAYYVRHGEEKSNGFSVQHYSIGCNMSFRVHSMDGFNFDNEDEFINYISNTDFINNSPKKTTEHVSSGITYPVGIWTK